MIERQPNLTGAAAAQHAEWAEFFLNDFHDYIRQIMAGQEQADAEGKARPDLLWAVVIGDLAALGEADGDEVARARELYRRAFETWIFQKLAGTMMVATERQDK